MSLVGSLEDLGLADILQIVSLSRKSGVLVLRSESGDGRIVLCNGLVQGATVKGEAADLRSLLVGAGCLDGETFDRAREVARAESLDLDQALGRECGLPPDRLVALRREHVERSVICMFGWRSGEFSFEIREDVATEDRELLLPSGLNTQYLAMEATRLGDESSREASDAGFADADSDDPVFSGEGAERDPPVAAPVEPVSPVEPVDTLAMAAVHRHEPEALEEAPRAEEEEVAVDGPAPGRNRVRVPVLRKSSRAALPPASHLVAIDSDLSALEWLKASVSGLFQRTHIFQRRDDALDRIRQYLARGVVPIVVLAHGGRSRDASAIETSRTVQRLRALTPAMPILAMRADGAADGAPGDFDGVLFRPPSPSSDRDRWHLYEPLAERLRADLERWTRGERRIASDRAARGVLGRLKGVSERLRDPSARGEVLSLVLEYAAEMFERVAIFMVRDEVAVGMAQHGLPPTGGPDDAALRELELASDAMPELFAAVLDRREAIRARLSGPRDRGFAARLGAATPGEVYAAPIESGGSVVALVYADNVPDDKPLPDTTAFEIVLHEVGLVLDRAVLERTLAERA